MKIFGFSLLTLFLFFVFFVIGAKYGAGVVAKIPLISSL
jgi:hypothetical protein